MNPDHVQMQHTEYKVHHSREDSDKNDKIIDMFQRCMKWLKRGRGRKDRNQTKGTKQKQAPMQPGPLVLTSNSTLQSVGLEEMVKGCQA